jgi:replicative DNA helicase
LVEPPKITDSRAVTEQALLGALLEAAEAGWSPPSLDLRPDQLRSPHAAATYQELLRLWRGAQPVLREDLILALVERHGAPYSTAAAYLRRLRADAPRQHFLNEYVRRIHEDENRIAAALDES